MFQPPRDVLGVVYVKDLSPRQALLGWLTMPAITVSIEYYPQEVAKSYVKCLRCKHVEMYPGDMRNRLAIHICNVCGLDPEDEDCFKARVVYAHNVIIFGQYLKGWNETHAVSETVDTTPCRTLHYIRAPPVRMDKLALGTYVSSQLRALSIVPIPAFQPPPHHLGLIHLVGATAHQELHAFLINHSPQLAKASLAVNSLPQTIARIIHRCPCGYEVDELRLHTSHTCSIPLRYDATSLLRVEYEDNAFVFGDCIHPIADVVAHADPRHLTRQLTITYLPNPPHIKYLREHIEDCLRPITKPPKVICRTAEEIYRHKYTTRPTDNYTAALHQARMILNPLPDFMFPLDSEYQTHLGLSLEYDLVMAIRYAFEVYVRRTLSKMTRVQRATVQRQLVAACLEWNNLTCLRIIAELCYNITVDIMHALAVVKPLRCGPELQQYIKHVTGCRDVFTSAVPAEERVLIVNSVSGFMALKKTYNVYATEYVTKMFQYDAYAPLTMLRGCTVKLSTIGHLGTGMIRQIHRCLFDPHEVITHMCYSGEFEGLTSRLHRRLYLMNLITILPLVDVTEIKPHIVHMAQIRQVDKYVTLLYTLVLNRLQFTLPFFDSINLKHASYLGGNLLAFCTLVQIKYKLQHEIKYVNSYILFDSQASDTLTFPPYVMTGVFIYGHRVMLLACEESVPAVSEDEQLTGLMRGHIDMRWWQAELGL